jgi:HK97 family phage major capsid protein
MKPEIRELLAQLDTKLNEMRSFISENNLDAAEKAKTQAAEIRKKIDLLKEVDGMSFNSGHTPISGEGQRTSQEQEKEVRSAFLKSLRGKSLNDNEQRAMSGLTTTDGGLVIPQDIQTMIHNIKRQYDALEKYVRTEPVSTRSGSRVLEKFLSITGFSNITELGAIPETDTPQFSPISYAIQDYAGILPISNTLLADSDQNLLNYVAQWIARKSMVTRNSKIITLLQTLAPYSFSGLDDVKTFLNTGLDPALAAGAVILTNQDGYNHLDQQKDNYGRYLMQPDPTQPGRFTLFGKPVAVVANRWLADTGATPDTAPFIVGDLQEAIVLFDRREYEIQTTNVGGDSFKRNSTDARVIDRFDAKLWDSSAAVYGTIALS